jgi:hypothetical protein
LSGRVGTEIPVGDPLTPGGGPGRAELRLEEEEGFEEEEAEVREVKEVTAKSEEVSEAPSPTWELFGHLLIEDTTRAGRYSVLRCIRCGTEAPLTDIKTFRKISCVKENADKEKTSIEKEVVVPLPRKCENCGREATASLCDSCATIFEQYAMTARPAPLRGRGGVKPPSVPGVDGWAWVSSLTTFFPYKQREGGREWWCPVPGCRTKAARLVDVTDHFREAHISLASRGWYEEFDAPTRRVRIRTWQGWVDEEKMQLMLEVKP